MTSPLAAFRSRHLLTQREAAEAVGIGLSTWRQLEREFQGRRASPSLLAHLAALDLLAEREIAWPKPPRSDDARDVEKRA
jgi:transcriptional regulator with XRE-family HTH domain